MSKHLCLERIGSWKRHRGTLGGRWEGHPPIRGHTEPLEGKREPRTWEWCPADT